LFANILPVQEGLKSTARGFLFDITTGKAEEITLD
jgi:hypothetical protein